MSSTVDIDRHRKSCKLKLNNDCVCNQEREGSKDREGGGERD